MKFLKSKIIKRYVIPKILVNNNNSKFAGQELKWFCENLNIEHCFAFVRYAQTHRQVEGENKVVIDRLKK